METELSRVVDALPGFVWTALPDGQIDFFNQRWCDYTGLPLGRSCGRGWQAAVHPEDLSGLLTGWQGDTAGAPIETDARVRRADGDYRWFLFRAHPSADASGQVTKWCGLSTDIDDRKQAEEVVRASERRSRSIAIERAQRDAALRQSEARLGEAERDLRLTLDSIPTITWRADQAGHVLSGNKRWFDYTGSTPEQVQDRRWQSFVHPDDLAALLEDGKPSAPAGNSAEAEARVRRFDGEYRWFLFRAEAARDESGEIVAWYGTITDIEDKKRAEDALRHSQARLGEAERELRQAIDTIPVFVAAYRPDGTRSFVNRTWQEYMGLSLEEATGPNAKAFPHFDPADAEAIDAAWRTSLASGQPLLAEARVRRADGQYRRHTSHRVPLRDEEGNIVRWYSVGIDIEDRKAAEDALRLSEARLAEAERELQLTVDSIPAMVGVLQPDGTLVFVNQTYRDYTGLSMEEATSGSRKDIHPDDAERIRTPWRDSLTTGQPFQMDLRLRRSDGAYRWHTLRRVPLRDDKGVILRWYGVASDIEERKAAEDALRGSEARLAGAERKLQLTINTIPTLVATYRPDGLRDFVNQTWQDYTGLSFDDAMVVERTIHPDDAARVTQGWQTALAEGVPFKTEMRLRRADGEYRWHSVHRVFARDEAGAIVKWYSVGVDIEERKRAEEALRESERNSRLIVDGIPGQVAIFGPGGEFEFVNRQIIEYFGTTLEDVTSKRHRTRETLHPEDLPRATELFKQSMASGEPFEFEVRGRRFDGVYRWFQSRGIPLRDTNGRIVRWLNLLIDIDERKHTEEALRQSEAELAEAERELRVTLDSIPAITWRAGANGYVQQLNKRWFEYTGTTHEQVRGWRWKLCVHPDDLDQLVELGSKYVTTGEAFDSEARLRRFDGEYRWFLFRPAPVRDESGRVVAWYGTITDIEDRKQAEAKVREAEGELQHMLDSIPAMIVRGGANGYIQYFSKQWFEYTGTTIETARGFRWHQALHPDDKDRLVEFGARFVATAEPGDCEARLRRFDGEYRWFLFRPAAVHDSAGNFVGWYGTVTDIEDRKQAEEKAVEAERELQRTIDTIPALVGTYTGDGVRQSVNKWAREYTGLSVETWMEAFHPDDAESIEAQWRECLTKGEPLEREHRVLAADGTYRWLLTRRVPLRDEAGKVIRWYGIAHDIEDRKRAEDALRTSELDLRKIVDSVPALAWSARLNGSAEFCNQSYVDYTGLSLEQLQNWGFSNAVHPDDVDQVGREYRAILASGRTGETEARLRRHDGEYRWFTFRATPLRDENGQPVKWYGIGYDVEERKRAEEELRRSETLLAEGQRISSTGTYAWGGDLTERMLLSEEFYRIFEFEQDSAVTFTQLIERFHPEDVPLMAERIERIDAGLENPEFQIRLRMPDSRIKYLRVLGRVIRHQDGRLERIGAVQDITRNRQAEEALDKVRTELAHVTRVMSLGALTASIAHEVNQPLAGIVTNASTCLRMLAADPPNVEGARETARRTIRDGNRAADVITRLRALFSKKAAAPEIVDLGEVAQEILALVSTDLLRGRIIVRAEVGEPLLVTGDRVQLQQVILNLVRNAMDAMSGVYDRPRDLLIRTDTDEDEARLIVKDAGVGVEAQTAERLFDAFYTTKSDGMGIGLSVSRSIVESHGGRLWVEPHDGPGATFAFSIPRQATSGADDGTAGAILTRPARGAYDLAGNA